jgi:hypothetical protein
VKAIPRPQSVIPVLTICSPLGRTATTRLFRSGWLADFTAVKVELHPGRAYADMIRKMRGLILASVGVVGAAISIGFCSRVLPLTGAYGCQSAANLVTPFPLKVGKPTG